MAGVADLKTNYERIEIESLYDGWKEGFEGNFPDGKITSTNFTFKNKFARKVIVDDKDYRMEGIALFSNGKLFQMTVFRSNRISDKNVLDKINKLNPKFFDSFEEIAVDKKK
jgi:major membrane immunogen (membrane-anchored lipoprotein)